MSACCDGCGVTSPQQIGPDEYLCKRCKLVVEARASLQRDAFDRYHMIQGMIQEEEARHAYPPILRGDLLN